MTPAEARAYIEQFRNHTLRPQGRMITFVTTSTGREIMLDDMTDEDALFVAGAFKGMELDAARRGRRTLQ